MKCSKLFLSLLGVASLVSCHDAGSQPTNQVFTPMYAIKNVTIVDVENGVAIPEQTVIIVDEQITQSGGRENIPIPQGATVINGEGLYLMPGLVDVHVHYYDAPIFGRLMIANGVLLVRDMGMPNEYILPLRDELNRGETLGPQMVTTGFILDGDPPIIPLISVGITSPDQGRAVVRQQAEAGVDMIKTYSRLEKDVFLAILDEAQKYDLPVAAHLPESIYIEDAAAAGLASSEHFNGFEKVIAQLLGEPARFYFAGLAADAGYLARLGEVDLEELRAVYERLGESGLTVCPTVVTFNTLTHISAIQGGSFFGSQYISQSVLEMWKALWTQQSDLPDFIWRNWMQMVVGLNRAGVPLMVGTDLMLPGIVPGFSVHEEMAIWQEAGIPAADILRSATIVPAQFMGLGNRLGSVDVGKTASIVLVRGNPLEDIRNTQQIEGVFLRGQYFTRSDLDRLLDEAKEFALQSITP